MKNSLLVLIVVILLGCKGEDRRKTDENSSVVDTVLALPEDSEADVELNLEQANRLVELPLSCIGIQYPNKLNQTLAGDDDIQTPQVLHPAFYGCFDWHSSVHAHWSLVRLVKKFPKLNRASEINEILETSLSKENIEGEMAYFQKQQNFTYERTYGWAWLLKLSEELQTWDTDTGNELAENLQPLTNLIVERFTEFLPKLNYPIRVGEHSNIAFALSFAHDFAVATNNEDFKALIEQKSRDFYLKDRECPLGWEPSGFDFLSPCLEEVDIMRKVLPKAAFSMWMDKFLPQLKNDDFTLEVGEVSDRTDGKLVHLDGLNFSRARVLYGLAKQYPEDYSHLRRVANRHVNHSFPNLVGDSYEGGHWLGSFAIYALEEARRGK